MKVFVFLVFFCVQAAAGSPADSLLERGRDEASRGNYGLAHQLFRKVLGISALPSEMCRARISLGNLYDLQGEYDSAVVVLARAHKTAQTLGDHKLLTKTNIALGNICFALGDLVQAQTHYSDALKHDRDGEQRAKIYINMGNVCWGLDRFSDAREYYKKALPLSNRPGDVYLNIGISYDMENSHTQAREYFAKALGIAEDSYTKTMILQNMGESWQLGGRPDSALFYCRKAEQIAGQLGYQYSEHVCRKIILSILSEFSQNTNFDINPSLDYYSSQGLYEELVDYLGSAIVYTASRGEDIKQYSILFRKYNKANNEARKKLNIRNIILIGKLRHELEICREENMALEDEKDKYAALLLIIGSGLLLTGAGYFGFRKYSKIKKELTRSETKSKQLICQFNKIYKD